MNTLGLKDAETIGNEAGMWLAQLEELMCLDETSNDPIGFFSEHNTEFKQWVNQGPHNSTAFLRLYSTWSQADRLAALNSNTAEPETSETAANQQSTGSKKRWFTYSVAASLVLVSVLFSSFIQTSHTQEFKTVVGGFQSIPLSDGSRLELNTNTSITAEITDKVRKVVLKKGEAYFDIAHDKNRPFVIDVNNKRVTVLGTKFSVKYDDQKTDALEIIVTEGKVRVDNMEQSPSKPIFIEKNMSALVTQKRVQVAENKAEDASDDLIWREGMLAFNNETLEAVAKEFNRYNRKKIKIINKNLATMRISGRFEAKNVGAFIRLLQNGYDIKIVELDNLIAI